MSHKIIFFLLLAIAGTKVFSQDSLKTSNPNVDSYAIMEIKSKAFSSPSILIIYYDNGVVEDISNKLPALYKEFSSKFPMAKTSNDVYSNDNTNSVDNMPDAQKNLVWIKYMAEKNYVLVSYASGWRYIFRKKE